MLVKIASLAFRVEICVAFAHKHTVKSLFYNEGMDYCATAIIRSQPALRLKKYRAFLKKQLLTLGPEAS